MKIIKLDKIIEYIENNITQNLSSSSLAQMAFFSEYHFSRIFRKQTGMSVMEYIRKERLRHAAYELQNKKITVAEIAYKYEFGSQDSFIRAFKKVYGATPGEYRQNYKYVKYQQELEESQLKIM